MALIAMRCPSCSGDIQLDDSKDFGFCMYCGTKVQITQKVKVEHSGTVSISGLATVENLIEKGFLNIASRDFEQAKNAFQNALAIDAHNVYAFIGMMCVSTEGHLDSSQNSPIQIYYQKIKEYSATFSSEESRYLGPNTCHAFAKAYAIVQDCDRLGCVLSQHPECRDLLCNYSLLALPQINILLQHVTPDIVFWGARHKLTAEILRHLISCGLNVNAPLDIEKGYPAPLGMAIQYAKIDCIKILLTHGADPNGSMEYWVHPENEPGRWVVNKYINAVYGVNMSYSDKDTVRALLKEYGAKSEKNGGCYIATCVYGSYDCPQVWILRRFRDTVLAKTWYGQAFIKTYYAISPSLVKLFGNLNCFKKFWQFFLDRLVKKLNSLGIKNSSYIDPME